MKTQKFLRGHRVKISNLPECMRHFDGSCQAVIISSMSDDYITTDSDMEEYKLMLDLEIGPKYSAWYPESILTLVSNDRDAGEMFLQKSKSTK